MKINRQQQKIRLGMIVISGLAVLSIGFFLFKRNQVEAPLWEATEQTSDYLSSESQPSESSTLIETTEILVDIKGAIKQPGVYPLPIDARLNELILLSGGFTEEAETRQLNLAEKLSDQQMIYVPNKEEVHFTIEQVEVSNKGENTEKSELINLNTADSQELQQLPGIGPAKAQAILTYREENGSFSNIDDLLQISGFGEKTVEKLRELVQI